MGKGHEPGRAPLENQEGYHSFICESLQHIDLASQGSHPKTDVSFSARFRMSPSARDPKSLVATVYLEMFRQWIWATAIAPVAALA